MRLTPARFVFTTVISSKGYGKDRIARAKIARYFISILNGKYGDGVPIPIPSECHDAVPFVLGPDFTRDALHTGAVLPLEGTWQSRVARFAFLTL